MEHKDKKPVRIELAQEYIETDAPGKDKIGLHIHMDGSPLQLTQMLMIALKTNREFREFVMDAIRLSIIVPDRVIQTVPTPEEVKN